MYNFILNLMKSLPRTKLMLLLGVLILCPGVKAQLTDMTGPAGLTAQEYSFVSDNVGYGKFFQNASPQAYFIYKTTDGGDNWTLIPNPPNRTHLSSIAFTADQVGYAITENTIPGNSDEIYKTTNDGANWTNVTPGMHQWGYNGELHFINDQVGYIKENQNVYYKTSNGGQSWDTLHAGISDPWSGGIQSLHAFDEDHIIAGFHDGTFWYKGEIRITSNGGQNWDQVVMPLQNGVIGSVDFASATTAYAAPIGWGASGNPRIYRTTNAGGSWDTLTLPVPSALIEDSEFTAFDFRTALEGYAIINNRDTDMRHFYQTLDGGDTWTPFGTTAVDNLTELHLTANFGYASGDTGSFVLIDLGTGIVDPQEAQFSFFPNPVVAGEEIQIEFEEQGEKTLRILTLQGQEVSRFNTFDQVAKVLVPGQLAVGNYLIEISTSKRKAGSKLMVR